MARLYRMTWSGNLPGGDVFSHGLHGTFGDTVIPADVLVTMENGVTALLTTASGIQSEYTGSTAWVSLKAEEINPTDGSVVLSSVTATNHGGTNGSAPAMPGQLSTVVSLRTAGFGRSDRGRFYLPALCTSSLGANTRITPAAITKMITSVSAYFAALKAAVVPCTPVVYSPKLHASEVITRYDIGDRFDVQRSRANKLVEGRAGAAI